MVTPLVKRPGPEVGRAAGSVLGGAENPPLSRNRGFQNLLFGYFLSGLGDQLYYVALPLMIYDLYRSPIASSSLRAVEFLPTALFGLVIGLLLDRYSRKRLLIGGLLVQALLVVVIPLGTFRAWLPYWAIYPLAFAMASAGLVATTGYEVVLPSLVSREHLVAASALIGYAVTAYLMLGPALAGLLLTWMNNDYMSLFTLDAVSFLIYGLAIIRIKITQPPRQSGSMLGSFRQGFSYIRRDRILRPLIAGYLTANLGAGLATPLLLFTMRDKLQVGATLIGLFFTTGSLGGLLGNTLYLRLASRLAVGRQMIWTGGIITVGFLAMGWASSFPVFTAGYFLIIAGSVWAKGNFYYIAQTRSPEAYRGRVWATSLTLARIAGPVMAATGGFLVHSLDISAVYYVAAAFFALSMVISWRAGLWAVTKVQPAETPAAGAAR